MDTPPSMPDLFESDTDLSSSTAASTAASNWDIDDLKRNCVQCGRWWKWMWETDTCQHCRDSATHMKRLCPAQHADSCAAYQCVPDSAFHVFGIEAAFAKKKVTHTATMAMSEELTMLVLEVVWKRLDYGYKHADIEGRGIVKLTLRRQIRPLNRRTAHWYRTLDPEGLANRD